MVILSEDAIVPADKAEALCTEDLYCVTCGEMVKKAVGHSFDAEGICDRCGKQEESEHKCHDFGEDGICQNCGEQAFRYDANTFVLFVYHLPEETKQAYAAMYNEDGQMMYIRQIKADDAFVFPDGDDGWYIRIFSLVSNNVPVAAPYTHRIEIQ